MSVTKEFVCSILNYDKETGAFFWKRRIDLPKKWNSRFAGRRAGCVKTTDGYERIRIGKRLYLSHRLAWLVETGEHPPSEIDHIDGNRLNNRIANLRPATSSQNSANTGMRRGNTSGAKGVIRRDRPKPWYVRIGVGHKTLVVGSFKTLDEAKAAYDRAAKLHFGEYAKTNKLIEASH